MGANQTQRTLFKDVAVRKLFFNARAPVTDNDKKKITTHNDTPHGTHQMS